MATKKKAALPKGVTKKNAKVFADTMNKMTVKPRKPREVNLYLVNGDIYIKAISIQAAIKKYVAHRKATWYERPRVYSVVEEFRDFIE